MAHDLGLGEDVRTNWNVFVSMLSSLWLRQLHPSRTLCFAKIHTLEVFLTFVKDFAVHAGVLVSFQNESCCVTGDLGGKKLNSDWSREGGRARARSVLNAMLSQR